MEMFGQSCKTMVSVCVYVVCRADRCKARKVAGVHNLPTLGRPFYMYMYVLFSIWAFVYVQYMCGQKH